MTETAKTLLQRVRLATAESRALLVTAGTLLKRHADLIEMHAEISTEFRESARSFIHRVATGSSQH